MYNTKHVWLPRHLILLTLILSAPFVLKLSTFDMQIFCRSASLMSAFIFASVWYFSLVPDQKGSLLDVNLKLTSPFNQTLC